VVAAVSKQEVSRLYIGHDIYALPELWIRQRGDGFKVWRKDLGARSLGMYELVTRRVTPPLSRGPVYSTIWQKPNLGRFLADTVTDAGCSPVPHCERGRAACHLRVITTPSLGDQCVCLVELRAPLSAAPRKTISFTCFVPPVNATTLTAHSCGRPSDFPRTPFAATVSAFLLGTPLLLGCVVCSTATRPAWPCPPRPRQCAPSPWLPSPYLFLPAMDWTVVR
jgi:hypothetical protein